MNEFILGDVVADLEQEADRGSNGFGSTGQ